MGFINIIATMLFQVWPGFSDWLKSKYILQHGYHGEVLKFKLFNLLFKCSETLIQIFITSNFKNIQSCINIEQVVDLTGQTATSF